MRLLISCLGIVTLVGCQSGSGVQHVQYGLQREQYAHSAAVVKQIEQEVPQRWKEKGSPHHIVAYDHGRMLDVQTTPENQLKISHLLQNWGEHDNAVKASS